MTFRETISAADVNIFDAVGDVIELTTAAGVSLGNISGAFAKEYIEINGIELLKQVFTCRTDAIPADPHNHKVIYNSITYRVVTPKQTDEDLTILVLEDA